MPLIYVNCPENTFSSAAKDALADELTTIALTTERLPDTPYGRSKVWIYFSSALVKAMPFRARL